MQEKPDTPQRGGNFKFISEAKSRWLAGPKYKQGLLFKGESEPAEQLELKIDVSGITDETFWNKLEDRIYSALKSYSEEVDGTYQKQLFAEDAAQGFSFIDICRKRYDVILMNPPFGEWSKLFKGEAKKAYPNSYNDILGALLTAEDRYLNLAVNSGQSPKNLLFLSSFTKWRENVVLGLLQPRLLVDLGHGVMDAAMVEAAAYIWKTFSQFFK